MEKNKPTKPRVSQKPPSKKNTKKTTRHKVKNLKNTQIKGSLASSHHKQWKPENNGIFKVLKENNYQPKIIYTAKYCSKMEVK